MAAHRLHAAVVYHPLKTNLPSLRAAVTRHQSDASWAQTRWYATSESDAGAGATSRALSDGASVVLAVGGDGTVRSVAEALRGTGVPIAVVPQGTGNLLARNLGAPLDDVGHAVRAAFLGCDRAIDLGVVTITRPDASQDAHVFLVLAGMGLDARAITATSSKLKKRVGWLAYVDGGMRALLSERPFEIQYSMAGVASAELTVHTVMIGNCGLLPGGVLLIPNAHIDDGQLDVVALRPLGAFSWLRIWHTIGWENGVLRKRRAGGKTIDLVHDARAVTYVQTGDCAISVANPEPVQLDGDDFGVALALHSVVDPGSLTVRVFAAWAGSA